MLKRETVKLGERKIYLFRSGMGYVKYAKPRVAGWEFDFPCIGLGYGQCLDSLFTEVNDTLIKFNRSFRNNERRGEQITRQRFYRFPEP